jgi:hypothetical protein
MSKNSKNEGNSVNQDDPDDIMRQSNKSKNQQDNMENIKSVGKGPKQDLGMETKIRAPPQWSRQFLLKVNPPADKWIPSWSLDS